MPRKPPRKPSDQVAADAKEETAEPAFKHRAVAIAPSLARQQWLEEAVEALRTKFATAGYTIPKNIRVSIGWPKRAASYGAVGECWSINASSDQHAELFISPELTDGLWIMHVLAHELDHATVSTDAGHGKAMSKSIKH